MDPDLCDFIFYVVNYVVKFQENIYFNNSVVEGIQLLQLIGNIILKFPICIKVHSLNVYVHNIAF